MAVRFHPFHSSESLLLDPGIGSGQPLAVEIEGEDDMTFNFLLILCWLLFALPLLFSVLSELAESSIGCRIRLLALINQLFTWRRVKFV